MRDLCRPHTGQDQAGQADLWGRGAAVWGACQ